MNKDKLTRAADDLAGLAGGYNLRNLIIFGLSGLAIGFLIGGFLGRSIGFWFLLIPVAAGLLAGGVAAYMRFQEGGGFSNLRQQRAATQSVSPTSSSGAPRQPSPAPPVPSTQTPVPVPAQLSELERQVMERVVQANGNVSVSALADELGVPADSVRQTIDDLIGRGAITLG